MKVKHLINELRKINPDLEVITEGCDCWGPTFRVEVCDGHERPGNICRDYVLIHREDREHDGYNNLDPSPFPYKE